MIKRLGALLLSLLMIFNGSAAFAMTAETGGLKLQLENTTGSYIEIAVEPKEEAGNIIGVTTDSVFKHDKIGSKNQIGWVQGKQFSVENGKLAINPLKNKHTLSLQFKDKTLHYIFKDGKFEPIDVAHPPKGKIHVKLEGYFEGALVGQRKYDATSGATGSVTDNKNSDIKVYAQVTEEGEKPKASAWKELSKSDVEVDKGKTKITLDPKSGMKASFNASDSSITLAGTPDKVGEYPVRVELVDIYGRKATSNEAWFSVSDIESVYLDSIMKNVNTRLKTTANGKVLFNQEPWYIAYFNEKNRGAGQSYTVPKNINLWQGSHESGTYGQLGLVLPVKDRPNRQKHEYRPDEDRLPIQNLVLNEGTNLTLVNMKVFSGVNIVVNKGATLTVHDSSIYGKITVNGGRLRINYDPEGKMIGDFKKPTGEKVVSGSSIQGQIILNDGAVLEDSYIYSNTNNLTDAGRAIQNTRPVVLVKGHAFIKGNVFVKGDESPTGNEADGKPYRGQNAMTIDGGSLTVLDRSAIYLYGGGTSATTSRGGHALTLANDGKVLGKGELIALGGSGHSQEGGMAVSGKGLISTAVAYLRGGNGAGETPAKERSVAIANNVVGKTIDGGRGDYPEYWSHSSIPKKLDKKTIGSECIDPAGAKPEEGRPSPLPEEEKPKNKTKRVEFVTNQFHRYSIQVEGKSDDSKLWLEKLKQGQGTVTVKGEAFKPVADESKGFKVEGTTLYIYGLKVGDEADIKVEGFVPVKLKAVATDNPRVLYRLEKAGAEEEDKPYVPEDEKEITEERVEAAKKFIKELVLDESALAAPGVNTGRNSSTITEFKKAVKDAKALAAKGNLSPAEKNVLVKLAESKFKDYTKNILVDMKLESSKTVANRHDDTRLHAVLSGGEVVYTSALENLSKAGNPKVKLYRIDKEKYEADAQTGATPKFEEAPLDEKYYDVKQVDGCYHVSVKEKELKKAFPNTALVKIVFSMEVANGVAVENADFVFLGKETNKPKKKDKDLVGEKDPEGKDPKQKDPEQKEKPKGHYEYRLTKRPVSYRNKGERTVAPQRFVEGYPDGSFKPSAWVTRAESAQMVFKMEAGSASKDRPAFKDAKDAWYNEAINFAVKKDMLLSKNGAIRPDEPMTRGEFARMLAPILPKKEGKHSFADAAKHPFEAAIEQAYLNGIVVGYPDKSFKPENKITRAEAVAMMNRLYKHYLTRGELAAHREKIKSFRDVPESHWAYLEIMSAVNYPDLKKRVETFDWIQTRYESQWDRVWVEDKKTPEKKPEAKKEFTSQSLEGKDTKISLKGKLTKGARLEVTNKTKIKDGVLQIIVAESILKDYKKLVPPEGKSYDIVASYDVKLIGEFEGELELSLPVDAVFNGRPALIKHLTAEGVKTYKATVESGRVTCKVKSLSPFAVIVERDKVDEALLQLQKDLAESIKEAEAKDTAAYTKSSVDALNLALKEAKAKQKSKDKAELKGALDALKAAMKNLTPKGDGAALKAKIDEAKQKAADDRYTDESKEALLNLLKKYENYDYADATKEALEAATRAVDEAVKGLKLIEVTVSVHKGGAVDTLKAAIGDKLSQLKKGDQTYVFADPVVENKEFLGWKINGKGDLVKTADLKEMVITKAALGENHGLKIEACFKDKMILKKVRITEILGTKMRIDPKDPDSKLWMEGFTEKGTIQKKQGEKVTDMDKNSVSVYNKNSTKSLTFTGLKAGDKVKISVPGFEDLYLKAEAAGGNACKLVQIKDFSESEAPAPQEELMQLQKDLAESIKEAEAKDTAAYTKSSVDALNLALKEAKAKQKSKDKAELKGALDALKAAMKNLTPKGDGAALKAKIDEAKQKAADDRYTDESKEALLNLLKKYENYDYADATKEALEAATRAVDEAVKGLKLIEVTVSVHKGGAVDTLKAAIGDKLSQLKKGDQAYVFADPVVENKEFLGWKINGKGDLVKTADLKEMVITKAALGENHGLKIEACFKDKMILKKVRITEILGTKMRIDPKDPDSKLWMEGFTEKGTIQKKQGEKVTDMDKNSVSVYNKNSTKSLTFTGLKAGDKVKISVPGFEDLYLKAEAAGGNACKLVQIKDFSESEAPVPQEKPMPKLGTPFNGQANVLNNTSPDANTLAWYKALYEKGVVKANGEVLLRKEKSSGDERGYYLENPEKYLRVSFRHLKLNEVISFEVEGWPALRFKVVDLKPISGPNSEKEAVFKAL
ncbi:S-layer homology domain-containing protein [Peptoniphilus sp. EMRHCC_23]|uniref:S-layer homology domain-containing protein n=1 Tax=Peptoniphilus rachelemmaiella TaxID=2811779 RepID=UPI001BFFF6EC|nr:S-layer homology domain-containing protein [Peptoniphilus rachelemmaiella]